MVGFIVIITGWLVINTILYTVLDKNQYPNSSWFHIDCSVDSARLRDSTLSQVLNNALGVVQQPTATAPVQFTPTCPKNMTYSDKTETCGDGKGNTAPPTIVSNTTGGHTTLCNNSACSPSVLQGDGFSNQNVANSMSCIAMTETAGGVNTDNNNGTGCNSSGFCGLFQIGPKQNVVSGGACGGTLDCPSMCKGGVGSAGCQPCVQALNNSQCNAQAASYLVQQNGYQPWTGNINGVAWNPGASTCVNTYDPGTSLRTQ